MVQAFEEAVQDRALQFFETLQSDMTQAQLIDIPAGAPYLHMSSAVLLRGSLRVTGHVFDTSAPHGTLKGESAGWQIGKPEIEGVLGSSMGGFFLGASCVSRKKNEAFFAEIEGV